MALTRKIERTLFPNLGRRIATLNLRPVLVDEVRVTGRYVFRKDKDRVKAYGSQYKR
ncbi:MAG: hypothetical protein MJA30_34940 [Cytophagales bacterium]|nr:hypothetical protein [Cytophagales bacterium]